MTNLKKSKKGFTLVELIVVIAILAIIAAVAIPTTISYVGKSERSTAASNASTVVREIQNKIVAQELKSDADADDLKTIVEAIATDDIASVTITTADGKATIKVVTNVDATDEQGADEGYSVDGGKICAEATIDMAFSTATLTWTKA